jgi:hypothetical protein
MPAFVLWFDSSFLDDAVLKEYTVLLWVVWLAVEELLLFYWLLKLSIVLLDGILNLLGLNDVSVVDPLF